MAIITEIFVKNLFGYLDYHIPLNTTDNITIIHGPNGSGKTWLLKLINAAFTSDFATLRQAPFEEIAFKFRDGGNFIIRRIVEERTPSFQLQLPFRPRPLFGKLYFEYQSKRTKKVKHCSLPITERERPLPYSISLIERFIPNLIRIGPREWRDNVRDEILDFDEVIALYGQRLPSVSNINSVPLWLNSITRRVEVYFIQSQRLIRMPAAQERQRLSSRRDITQKDITQMVELDSINLAQRISELLKQSVKIGESKDRTFPTRLLQSDFSSAISESQLREEFNNIDTKRRKLYAAGLLDEEESVPLPSKSMTEMEQKVLTLYVRDVADKLKFFDDLENRIAILMNLINSKMRTQGKTLFIDRDRGFLFKTHYGDKSVLNPADLSSGEQHELVLFYELIFKPTGRSLFLIDEPEISLNVGWQRRFLNDLGEAIRLGKHSVILATHSPQIIHNRWDLAVSLKGGIKE